MGFTDRDWGDSRPPRPRRHPRPDPQLPTGSMVLVVDGALTDAAGRLPDIVDAYRDHMTNCANAWAERHGFTVRRGSWASLPPVDRFISVPIRLECFLAPRTDGQWPAIHAAVAEDQRALYELESGSMAPEPDLGMIVVHIES